MRSLAASSVIALTLVVAPALAGQSNGQSHIRITSQVRSAETAHLQDVHSANWERFSGNGPDFIYIDRQSVTPTKSGFTIWVKSENAATDPGASALLLWEVDCEAWDLSTISGTGYFPAGKTIPVPQRLHEPMPPNSVGNGIAKTFCPKTGSAASSTSARGADIVPLTAGDFSLFSMTYYEHPRPDLIEKAMLFFDRSGWAEIPNHQLAAVMTFSCIAHRPEQKAQQWTATIESLHEPARSLLRTAISTSPDDLLSKTPASARKNDGNWACFFATGNTKYIRNLLDVAAHYGERKDKDLYLTAATAMWSLVANSGVPEVHRYLQSDTGPVSKAILETNPEAITAEIKNTLAEQHQKGIW